MYVVPVAVLGVKISRQKPKDAEPLTCPELAPNVALVCRTAEEPNTVLPYTPNCCELYWAVVSSDVVRNLKVSERVVPLLLLKFVHSTR